MPPADAPTPPYTIVGRPALSQAERAAAEELVARCNAADGLRLRLNLSEADPAGATRYLLAYAGDALVGCAALEDLGGIEVSGLVDPAHRRRGLGRALVAATRDELRGRGLSRCLLVCDEAAPAAAAFCAAVGAAFRFAEYRLDLDEARAPAPRDWPVPLDLRPATRDDVPDIARISAAAFHDSAEARHERILGRFRPGSHYYVARLAGATIGAIRTVGEEGAVYITSFAVDPAHQGRGHGRQILARTVAMLLAAPARPIVIEVETDNRNALALYQSCGFEQTSRYGYYELAWDL
jgi:ribosomal protein S18 acetylase RimI-like enzyme